MRPRHFLIIKSYFIALLVLIRLVIIPLLILVFLLTVTTVSCSMSLEILYMLSGYTKTLDLSRPQERGGGRARSMSILRNAVQAEKGIAVRETARSFLNKNPQNDDKFR